MKYYVLNKLEFILLFCNILKVARAKASDRVGKTLYEITNWIYKLVAWSGWFCSVIV